MPLLQFDTTLSLLPAEKTSFAESVTELYTAVMATTDGHVAVTIRDRESADLHLGRAVEGPLLVLDAEIRQGRSFDRKRRFALAVMEHAASTFDVPDENMKVVFTEHQGEAMMGVDRVGGEWNGERNGEGDGERDGERNGESDGERDGESDGERDGESDGERDGE